jgi:hypothetical protein
MQTFNKRTKFVGCISAQYLIDQLYAFLENHSNSEEVNCSRAGVLGLRRDAFA